MFTLEKQNIGRWREVLLFLAHRWTLAVSGSIDWRPPVSFNLWFQLEIAPEDILVLPATGLNQSLIFLPGA